MNDERDHDGEKIKKYYGPRKTTSVEQYASANLNNNAFANEDSAVKPKESATGEGPSKVMDIKPIPPTGKKKGDGKKIKVVDTPPKKEASPIPTVAETAERKEEPKTETPIEPPPAETPVKEEPTETPQENNGDETVSPPVMAATGEAQTSEAQTDTPIDTTKEPTEFDPYGDTKTDEENPDMLSEKKGSVLDDDKGSRQQKEWKPSVTSQRMMDAGLAGLNMFGGIMGGANKAFSMLRGLASALTSRQLMSDPTLPARGFLNAMEQSGQIVEDHIKQVGEAYGIKDGVKRDDLVGTYKGAQYYREKQQIENAEKQYYAGVGNALSAVLGNNVDVNDTVGIQNALAQMSPQQLSQLDDALFGQNGSLKDMYEATVVNPMGSTREQKARAQLLTTLNQSLKGQAQANAREAGRQRTQANQQIQQYNQEIRRLKIGQEKDIANSNQLLSNPQAMASMTDDAQMEVFVNAVLGRRVNSKQIPTNQNGEVEIDKLGSSDLNRLREVLSRPEFQNLSGAQKLRANVVSRLEAIKQNNAQYNQAYRQSQFAQYANSPLDIDLDRRKGLDRDGYGIPNSSKGREGLMNRAYMIRDDLVSNGGSQKDIDLCDNVIMMCRMADMRDDLMGRIDKLEEKGAVSPLLAEHLRNQAQSAYRRLNDHLAVSYDERERRIRSNLPWSQGLSSDIIRYEMGGINSSLDRMETDFDDTRQASRQASRQAARMAELAKIEEKEKAEAALDDRGVPRGLQVYRNRMRKALNGNLALIETEMASLSMNSPEDHFRRMALAQEKLSTEQQLLRIGQEDHIQKMLSDARAHGLGDQAEAAANRLREQYSDWNDFGEALNQERRAMGMPEDTKWNATASAQRAQGLQNQTQALINAIGSLEQAMKGQPGAMKDMLKDFLGDKDVLDKVKDILHENNIDLKHMIIGKGNIKMHGVVVNAIKDAFKKNIQNKITGMFQTAVSNALNPVTDGLINIQTAVSDLGDAQKSGIISAVNGVNTSLSGVRDMLTQCLNDSATGQPIKVEDLRNSLNSYMQSNQDLIKKLNEKIPLGGTMDDKYGIPSEVLEQLQNNQEAIKTQNENLKSLVRKLDAGMVTREELADVVDKLSKVTEKVPSGTELEQEGNALASLVDDIKDLIDKGGYVYGFVSDFAKKRVAQGLDPAVPVAPVEDPMNNIQAFFETLANKVEEDAMSSKQDQIVDPAGASLDDASETDQNVVSEATEEPEEGEIYEDRYVDPETGVYTPPAEEKTEEKPISEMTPEEFDKYMEDNYSDLFTQNEDLSEEMRQLRDEHPLLFNYVMNNPDSLLDMYVAEASMNGKGGPTLHQSYKNLLQNAQVFRAFGDDDETNERAVEQMVDEMLGASNISEARQITDKWLGDNPSSARKGAVNNASTMVNRYLDDLFTINAKRKHDAELADATQKGLNAETIRDYFKYLHKEARPTQAELRAARTEARKQQQQQDRDRANQEAWEKQREPTAQALGMDLSTQEGKQAYDAVYRGIIQRNAPVLYDGDRMDATVRNTYIPVLKELREQNTPESKQMFDKIMDSLMPALFQQTSINGGDNTKEASLGFDRNAAVKGLQLAREGRLGNRNAELFSPENLFDIWAEGRNTHIGNQGRSIIQEAYQLGKAEVAREKKIDAFYNPVMSGKVFGDHIEGIQGQMEKLNKIEPWSKIKTANAGKPQETRRDEYEKIKSNLEKEVKVAEDHLKALNDIYGRIGTGYYKDSEARQVEIPPEKVEEIENEIKAKLGDIKDWEKVVREKKKDIRTLNTSIKNITNDMIKKQKEAEEKAKAAAKAEAAKKKEKAKVEQPAQPTETPIEQPAQPTETPVETPKEPEKQDYYTEEKSPQALIDEMGEWLGEDDVHSVQEMLPDNATQEQWLAAGLKAIAGKSRDPVSTLRNWAEAMGMNPDEVVYHPKNTSTIDEIAKRIVDFRRGVTEPKQPTPQPTEERAEQPAQPAGYKMNGYDPKGFASNVNRWVRTSGVADKIKNAQKVFADKWRQDHKDEPNSSFREAPQEELTTIALQEILKSVDNPEEVLKSWGEAFGADTSDWKVDRDTINGIAGMLVNGSPDLDNLHRTPDGQIDWAGVETGATMLPGRWNRKIYDDIVAKKIGKLTGGNPKKVMYDYLDKLNSLSSGYKFKSPEEIAYAFTRGDGVKIPEQEAAKAEIKDKINKMYPDMTYRNFRAGLKTVGPFIPRLKEMGLWNDTPIEEENDDMDISEEESKQYQSYFD